MSKNDTFYFLFFLLKICCHFQSETSGFSLKKNPKCRQSQIDILLFLKNIKYMAKCILPSDTNIVYRYLLLVYSIIFAGKPLMFINFILIRSEDRVGILSLNRVWRTSVILTIERSINFYFYRICDLHQSMMILARCVTLVRNALN